MTALRKAASSRPAALAGAAPLWATAIVLVAGCDLKGFDQKPAASAQPDQAPASSHSAQASPSQSAPSAKSAESKPQKKKIVAKPLASVKPNEDDPLKGKWTLEEATKGLSPGEDLWATLQTDLGDIECKLWPDKSPIAVANFVGLARGLRPWHTPQGTWEKKPAFDGTVFHRVRKGFLIQGGDPKGDGTGDAGYSVPDEIWEDANHDRAGLLCLANRGPNTGSAQFFITDGPALHLDDSFTIFGECGPLETIRNIASLDVEKNDRPKSPPVIRKVAIGRRSGESSDGGDAAPTASASAGASASSAASSAPPKKSGAAAQTAAPKPSSK